ncbi:hypothetical protein [Natronomonas gomsonensis]|uniref:hypothetical protein n=1 Tax=Natronomonas gomsonensis TaxID=1046043 RepID=UPI00398C70C4
MNDDFERITLIGVHAEWAAPDKDVSGIIVVRVQYKEIFAIWDFPGNMSRKLVSTRSG